MFQRDIKLFIMTMENVKCRLNFDTQTPESQLLDDTSNFSNESENGNHEVSDTFRTLKEETLKRIGI